jgi:hypothetical protein
LYNFEATESESEIYFKHSSIFWAIVGGSKGAPIEAPASIEAQGRVDTRDRSRWFFSLWDWSRPVFFSRVLPRVPIWTLVYKRERDLGFLSGMYSRREYLAGVMTLA